MVAGPLSGVALGLAALVAAPTTAYPGPVGAGGATMTAMAAAGGGAAMRRAWRRRRIASLHQALAPLTGPGSTTRIRASRWRGGFRGAPTKITINYDPAARTRDPKWLPAVLETCQARLGVPYQSSAHDEPGCQLTLRYARPRPGPQPSPAQARAERTLLRLLGPGSNVCRIETDDDGQVRRVHATFEDPTRFATIGHQRRLERTFTEVTPGRWRGRWDLENDQVTFEVRPVLPSNVWLPPAHPCDTEDLLRNYRRVQIPYAVDEDGEEIVWRPAELPHMLVTGGTGTGKALACTTPIPTPSGWTTMGELSVGDVLFDEQGQRCTVTGVYDQPHGRPCSEVVFSDGSVIVADDDHQWWTLDRSARRSAIRASLPRHRAPRVPRQAVVELKKALGRYRRDDLISLAEVRAMAGAALPSAVLRALALQVGPCATRGVQMDQRYPQTELYPGRPLLVEMVRYAAERARPGSPVSKAGPVWRQALAAQVPDLLSLDDLAQLAGVPKRTDGRYEHLRQVTRSLPVHPAADTGATKSVIRIAGRELLYPARDLLARVIEASTEYRSDQRHLQSVGRVRTTRQIAQTLLAPGGQRNHSIPVTRAIDLPAADLPVPPYALGAWLGDGTTTKADLTTADLEMLDLLAAEGVTARPTPDPIGYALRWSSPLQFTARRSSSTPRTVACARCGAELKTGEPTDTCAPCRRVVQCFRSALRHIGVLGRKHIPPTYLRASIEQRRALLAGLLDTDGTVSPQGTVHFDNTNEQLARDVLELALSLGYRATMTSRPARLNGKACGSVYRVAFTCRESPFRLARKSAAHRQRCGSVTPARVTQRYITHVRPVDSVPVRCITVDSASHLFLAGRQFIPTHNTSVAHSLLNKICQHDWPVWVLDGKRVEFLHLRDWPNVQIVATTVEQQVALIYQVKELVDYRYALIEEGRARVEDFEPLVVFLDEWSEFINTLLDWYADVKRQGEPAKPPTVRQEASLARKARVARVHLVKFMQRADVALMGPGAGGEVRSNFGMRLTMGPIDPDGAQMMWGNPATGVTLPRGVPGRATALNRAGLAGGGPVLPLSRPHQPTGHPRGTTAGAAAPPKIPLAAAAHRAGPRGCRQQAAGHRKSQPG